MGVREHAAARCLEQSNAGRSKSDCGAPRPSGWAMQWLNPCLRLHCMQGQALWIGCHALRCLERQVGIMRCQVSTTHNLH